MSTTLTKQPTTAERERPAPARRRLKPGPQLYLVLVFVAVAAVGSSTSPFFFTPRNLENIVVAASVVAVLGVAQFIVVVTRGIDLSVGSIAALSTLSRQFCSGRAPALCRRSCWHCSAARSPG